MIFKHLGKFRLKSVGDFMKFRVTSIFCCAVPDVLRFWDLFRSTFG